MKKISLTFLLFFIVLSVSSQQTVHNYKYIVVKDQFNFLKKLDQHQTSSLTKFLFNKYGYTAILSNEQFPSDLNKNRCLALFVDMNKSSNMFTTKLTIVLKDCKSQVVFTSKEGRSKNKSYRKAYHEAIKLAFNSIKVLNYKYQPKEVKKNVAVIPKVIVAKPIVITKKVISSTSKIDILFPQPKENGFQLVDDKPTVVFQILKTSVKDVYIIKNKNGILFKNNKLWIAEFYESNTLVIKKYQIKF